MKKNVFLLGVLVALAAVFTAGVSHVNAAELAHGNLPAVKWLSEPVETGELSYLVNPQYFTDSDDNRASLRATLKSGDFRLRVELAMSRSVEVGATSGVGVTVNVESDHLSIVSGDFSSLNTNSVAVVDSLNSNKASLKMLYDWSDKTYRLGLRPADGGGIEFYVTNTSAGNTRVLGRFLAGSPEVWLVDQSVKPETEFIVNPVPTSCTNVSKVTFQILDVKQGESVLMADESTVYPTGYNFVCPRKQIISYHNGRYRFSRGAYVENILALSPDLNILVGGGGYSNAYYGSPNPGVDAVVMLDSDPIIVGEVSLLNSNYWQSFVAVNDQQGGLFISEPGTLPGMSENARTLVPYTAGNSQILFCPAVSGLAGASPSCAGLIVYEQTADGQQFVSANGRMYWSLPLRGGAYIQTSGYKPGGAPGSEASGSTGSGSNSNSGSDTSGNASGSTSNSATPSPAPTGVLGSSASFANGPDSVGSTAKVGTQVLGSSVVLASTGANLAGVTVVMAVLVIAYLWLVKRRKYVL